MHARPRHRALTCVAAHGSPPAGAHARSLAAVCPRPPAAAQPRPPAPAVPARAPQPAAAPYSPCAAATEPPSSLVRAAPAGPLRLHAGAAAHGHLPAAGAAILARTRRRICCARPPSCSTAGLPRSPAEAVACAPRSSVLTRWSRRARVLVAGVRTPAGAWCRRTSLPAPRVLAYESLARCLLWFWCFGR